MIFASIFPVYLWKVITRGRFASMTVKEGKDRSFPSLLLHHLLLFHDEFTVENGGQGQDQRDRGQDLLSVDRMAEELISARLYGGQDAASDQ